MNYKLILSFDGTNYHGWQYQKNAISIEETLRYAMRKLLGKATCIYGCSRTDTGVHALYYVCNFYADTAITPEKMPCALNTYLPNDIRVKECEIVDDAFQARFCATSKEYLYQILNTPINDPFLGRYSHFVRQKLNFERMQQAAPHFLGEHDFRAFMLSSSDANTTIRTIYSIGLTKENDMISFKICGNGFLHNMVRIIVGTLINVGLGKIDPSQIPDIIASRDRTRAGITAQPQGLFLSRVDY